jgi:hypothetical protein
MTTTYTEADWSEWRAFPDPRQGELLIAPYGPGLYELRHWHGKLILFGSSAHVASRMSSLLPHPYGTGTRNNTTKRNYVLAHCDDIEYRTLATATVEEARSIEAHLKAVGDNYVFAT